MPMLRDVQFGLRFWKSGPGFTAVAVATLALGIAVNTTVFGWIDAVLWHPRSQRTQDLGIRMALGARPSGVRWLVVREGLRLTLVKVEASDPVTLGAAGLVGLVSLAATYLPAFRATRLNPMQALRRE